MHMKNVIQLAIGLTGYCVWGGMAYLDPAQRPDFLKFNVLMAAGTIGVVVRDMKSPAETPFPSPDSPTTTKDPA